jgi:zinc protease
MSLGLLNRLSGRVCSAGVLLIVMGLASVSPAAGPLRLPPVERVQLKNGLVVLIQASHRLPLVDFRLVVRAGSVDDPQGKEGLANLTADLLTQGAGTRDAQQFAEAVAFLGGELSAAASREQVVVACEVLRKDFQAGLELFRDCVVKPTFAPEEFRRKQGETLGAIESQKDDPSAVADLELPPLLMGSHPLAHPVIGLTKSVSGLTCDDVVSFYQGHVTPDQSILAVVGDVDRDAVIPALEAAFSDWKPAKPAAAATYAAVEDSARKVLVVNRPDLTQSQIRFAGPGVSRNHPDYYAITVANTILGAGFTSRLMNEIRVVRGLTYGISSRFSMYRNAGTFTVNTFTRNESLRECIDAVSSVIRQLVDEGPTDKELEKAKRYLTGQFPLRLQSPDDLAERIADIEFYGLDRDYLAGYCDRIDAVTMVDVRRVLRERCQVDKFRILVVSQSSQVMKALEGLGPVESKELE